MGLWDQLASAGSAYIKHIAVIRQLVEAEPAQRNEMLANYVRGLSDSSFAGFKVLAFNALSEQKNEQGRGILSALVRNLDAARRGETLADAGPVAAARDGAAAPSAPAPAPESAQNPFDADVAFCNKHWVNNADLEQKRTVLIDFLISINDGRYQDFMANLAQMETNQLGNIKAHKANELNSWGRFFEDRMAYFNARARTGQSDPRWLEGLRTLESGLADIRWIIKSCTQFWPMIQKKKQAAAQRHAAAATAPSRQADSRTTPAGN